MPPFVRSPYNYDMDVVSEETGFTSVDPSLAQQEFTEECDINTIVRRFGITGQLPEVIRVPTYGDFTGISDFQSALHAIRDAEEAFMELPAEVRKRFDNDPQQLLEFVTNPANTDEAVKLGLATARAVRETSPTPSTTVVPTADVSAPKPA